MADVTICGVRAIQHKSPNGKHTWYEHSPEVITVELSEFDTWRAPLGFSVTEVALRRHGKSIRDLALSIGVNQ